MYLFLKFAKVLTVWLLTETTVESGKSLGQEVLFRIISSSNYREVDIRLMGGFRATWRFRIA